MARRRESAPAPWYVQVVDAAGTLAARAGLRSDDGFDADRLRRLAQRHAGVVDFGEPAPGAALEQLCSAFLAQSRASQTGRLAMHAHLLELLVARLRLQQACADAGGAVEAQTIARPVFVFGLPRTGTTLLHNLIAEDPAVRVPFTWEVMLPTPVPGAYSDGARRARVASRLRWVDRLAPEFRSVHAVEATLPQECIAITAHALQSIEFHTTHRVPAYQDWLEASDQRPAYRFHRRFLQFLQYRDGLAGTPPRRWVLKAPGHLFGLDALLAVYPDAVLVQTHRDPLQVVGSISSHGVILRQAFSRDVDAHEVAADWASRWAGALARTMRLRETDPALDRRILDLDYADVVADPVAAVARIYEHAALPLTGAARDAMAAHLAARPQGHFGRHRYTLDGFGLDADRERERFAAYHAWLGR